MTNVRSPIQPFARLGPWALVTVVLLACTTSAHAGGAEDKAFRKQAKGELKQLRLAIKTADKSLKTALGDASKAYSKEESSAAVAIAAAVDAITDRRNDLEDAAIAAAEELRVAGLALLVGPEEGDLSADLSGDFVAGAGGTWDRHLVQIEKQLDKADARLTKRWDVFLRALSKVAKKRDEPLRTHVILPPHGEEFWRVSSPVGSTALPEGGLGSLSPALLQIAVRFLSVDKTDTLELGYRGTGFDEVGVLSSELGGGIFFDLGPLVSGAKRVSEDDIGALLPVGSAFVVLEAGLGLAGPAQFVLALPRPSIVEPNADLDAGLKTLKKQSGKALKGFGKVAGATGKELAKSLASHVEALKKGFVNPQIALSTGFCDLQMARGAVSAAREMYLGMAFDLTDQEFEDLILTDRDLNEEFQFTSPGVGAKLGARVSKREVGAQARLTKLADRFVKRLLKTAGKAGQAAEAHWLFGRDRPTLPLFMRLDGASTDFAPRVEPHLSDVYMLVTPGLLGEGDEPSMQVDAELVLRGDPAFESSALVEVESEIDGLVDTGFLDFEADGSAKDQVPGLSSIPLVGNLFRSGLEQAQSSLIIVVTPQLADTGDGDT